MKKRHVIIGTLLALYLLLINAVSVLASTYEGHLDSVEGNTISGWAWNSADCEAAVTVNVTVKKYGSPEPVQESTLIADQYREELPSAGKGTGKYGFTNIIDWSQLEAGLYTVECTVSDAYKTNTLYYQNGKDATISGGSLIPLGIFKSTAYCPCRSCSSGWGARTSTGAIAAANHTIAVDPRVIPYGSRLLINGVIYTAEDRGGGVRGKHVDIFHNTHGECRNYGVRNVEAFLVP